MYLMFSLLLFVIHLALKKKNTSGQVDFEIFEWYHIFLSRVWDKLDHFDRVCWFILCRTLGLAKVPHKQYPYHWRCAVWKVSLQTTVASSITETNFMVSMEVMNEAIYLRGYMRRSLSFIVTVSARYISWRTQCITREQNTSLWITIFCDVITYANGQI